MPYFETAQNERRLDPDVVPQDCREFDSGIANRAKHTETQFCGPKFLRGTSG